MYHAPEYKCRLHSIIRYIDHVYRCIDRGYSYMYFAPEYKCKLHSTIVYIDIWSI